MPLGFILYDSSLYLHARFGWSQATLGNVLWIPPFGWEVGYFFWGFVIDRFGPAFPGPDAGLAGPQSAAGVDAFAARPAPSCWAICSWPCSRLAGFVVLAVAYATRAFPPGHSGLLAGIGAGSWGAIVALTEPWFGRLFDQSDYAAAFRIATVFPIAGYLIWLALERTSPCPTYRSAQSRQLKAFASCYI